MSGQDDGLHLRPPPRPRSRLRRHARWLLPVIALWLTPIPVALAVAAIGLTAWVTLGTIRVTRAARARRAAAIAQTSPARSSAAAVGPAAPIYLGADARGAAVSLDDQQLGAHGLILGASGSGKSTTLLGISTQQILQGRPVVAIDLKGSPDFAAQLGAAAAAAGRPLRVWTPDGPDRWNPLAHGNPTELKDKLIGTERFTEPHYQRAAERYAQIALQVREEIEPGRPAGLGRVVELLDPTKLRAAARGLSPERRGHVDEYVRSLTPDQLSAVRGLQSRLAVISESHTGRFLEPAEDAIDLRRALQGPEVVLFSLNASTYGQLSAQLGALVVQDLVSAAGARERAGGAMPPATVAIDEFSGLGADHTMALIARGRSAGVSVLLATQELADLDRVARGFRQQVLGSTAVKIAHRQDVAESAQEIARLAGSEPVWEASYSQADGYSGGRGRVNHRVVQRPRVDSSVVQSLRPGEAVVMTKTPRSETHLTRMQRLGLSAPSAHSDRAGPGRDGPVR